jgi:hypothetical protein
MVLPELKKETEGVDQGSRPSGCRRSFRWARRRRSSGSTRVARDLDLGEEQVAVLLERYGTACEAHARRMTPRPWRQPLQSLPDY